jgi:threonine dehydrogenase-like Zn-dependent dehydrogenase
VRPVTTLELLSRVERLLKVSENCHNSWFAESHRADGNSGTKQVEAVGPNVTEVKPGDYVVATARRPGHSIYDQIGTYDMTTDDVYYERGINLRHGFLTEYYVDDAEYIVKIPPGLREVGVLLEPTTVVEKGIAQAYEIQRRLKVWHPRRAAVMGAGTIGLLATLALRLRGLQVTTFALNLVLSSVTGGGHMVQVPADKINLQFVLGNK